MIHDSILGTVGRTPVVRLNRIPPKHVDIYVKLEMFNPASSVKDRLALGIILDAEQRGALKPVENMMIRRLRSAFRTGRHGGVPLLGRCSIRDLAQRDGAVMAPGA